jgi:hypothetical protein
VELEEELEEDPKRKMFRRREKINLKVSSKFQINLSMNGDEKTFKAIWGQTNGPIDRQSGACMRLNFFALLCVGLVSSV